MEQGFERWIVKELEEYKSIYRKCNDEVALKYCAHSMIRMLNCLCEMNGTQFYVYEKKMLWEAIRIFSKQCRREIYKALNCEKVLQKGYMIKNIETSMGEMLSVYNHIFESTSGMDYQMVRSLAVNSGTHELSAKLCTFYSSILDKLIQMFPDEGMEYAFVLHPTLQSIIESKVLLDERDAEGKVIIIYMPENAVEKFDLVSVCLFHEAFHVLTQEERNRKLRGRYFMRSVLSCIEYLIFDGVEFSKEELKKDEEIQERLIRRWFAGIEKSFITKTSKYCNGDQFYGEELKEITADLFREFVMKIMYRLNEDLMEAVYGEEENVTYSVFREHYEKVLEWENQIRNNCIYILNGNSLWGILNTLLQLYRECYADIACIITLELEPDKYKEAFQKSISFQYDSNQYTDMDQILRAWLVADTVKEVVSKEIEEKWNKYAKELESIHKENLGDGQPQNECVNMILSNTVIKCFAEYLRNCAQLFATRCKQIQLLPEFRKQIKKIIDLGNQECLMSILSGTLDIEDILQEDEIENS